MKIIKCFFDFLFSYQIAKHTLQRNLEKYKCELSIRYAEKMKEIHSKHD